MTRRFGPTPRTRLQRRASMVNLLYNCRPEKLAEMTAQSLVGPGAKAADVAEAERLLAAARASRL